MAVSTASACMNIRAFGGCSLSAYDPSDPEGAEYIISADEGRAKKHWSLIQYLVFSGKAGVTVEELIDFLWPEQDGDGPDDPWAALRILVHRARSELNRLTIFKGSQLILFKNKMYSWNRLPNMNIDADQFITMYQQSRNGSVVQRLDIMLSAVDMYQGRFLPNMGHSHWVMTLDAYYHTHYIKMCEEAVALLKTFDRHQDILNLCKRALAIDPYVEHLHLALMEALSALGFYKEAIAYYDETTKMLMNEFGVSPSEELQSIYNSLTTRLETQHSDIGQIRQNLFFEETDGAFYIEYSLFKQVCHLKMRECVRSGQSIQLGLVSLSIEEKNLFPERELNLTVEQLGSVVRSSLRQGDLYTHYSNLQYLVLLQSTNYENGMLVLGRIENRFKSLSPVYGGLIYSSLLPLTPQSLELDSGFLRSTSG